jgi:phosphoglucomutase
MNISPTAGKIAGESILVDIPKLITAYYEEHPDADNPAERVVFGTSGHRGSSFERSFNEDHIVAIAEAIRLYRTRQGIDGPLYFGIDSHPLSRPAFATALEVLAASGVEVMIDKDDFTPTPTISHAILTHNRGRTTGLADGIVVTPSHNPPEDGGFKYNPPHGGPASSETTKWIESTANELLAAGIDSVRRVTLEQAMKSSTTHDYDYVGAYVGDLASVIDLEAIKESGIKLGVDPLGGAGVHYWAPIADRYGLNLTVVRTTVDPTFRFMSVDWDGRIRMDPSSPYAMSQLIDMKDKFDVSFACDTDHDRHGIVAKSVGLMPPNHYLATCIHYLFSNRPEWAASAAVGKTVVSSSMIDRVAAKLGRKLYEVPVGFKFFVDGLLSGALGFGGEESAGASFLRRDGTVWTTDKDGIIATLLAAEMTAKLGRDPGEIHARLAADLGGSFYVRTEAPANAAQKRALANLGPAAITDKNLAGDAVTSVLTSAPGDGNAIGGVKVVSDGGWFAARPSGTEDIYKIYAESFRSAEHLAQITKEAQAIVDKAVA